MTLRTLLERVWNERGCIFAHNKVRWHYNPLQASGYKTFPDENLYHTPGLATMSPAKRKGKKKYASKRP